MPTSNTDHACRWACALTAAALFFIAGLGPSSAQIQIPPTRFDELFAGQSRAIPTFARPDVAAQLPPLPAAPEGNAPAPTASTGPSDDALAETTAAAAPGDARPQDEREHADRKGVVRILKDLIAPPAEAEPSPAAPSGETAQTSAAQDTTGSLGRPTLPATQEAPLSRPTRVSRLGERMLQQWARNTGASRAGRRIAGRMLRAGRPQSVGRLGGGRAVWYQHPGRTASGERFNPNALTAAHPSLPFGTRVRVVNKRNGRSVIVRINDRMSKANAAIDLSRAGARALGIEGVGSVALYTVR